MRSSLRRFHSLHSLVPLARFISRAPDTHAFQQVDVAQAALVASWRTLLQGGQILPFDSVGFQTYSENREEPNPPARDHCGLTRAYAITRRAIASAAGNLLMRCFA